MSRPTPTPQPNLHRRIYELWPHKNMPREYDSNPSRGTILIPSTCEAFRGQTRERPRDSAYAVHLPPLASQAAFKPESRHRDQSPALESSVSFNAARRRSGGFLSEIWRDAVSGEGDLSKGTWTRSGWRVACVMFARPWSGYRSGVLRVKVLFCTVGSRYP
jgi:hypothetical protein